jgi:predicted nucleic acid-binding protein
MAAQADWIVSGDRHLLALKRHAGSAIISLAHFLAELET